MAASEKKRGRKGRPATGKPFQPGNKFGNRFKPGESGNPGGRPKSERGFREKCRSSAERLRVRLVKLAGRGGPFDDTSGLVRAFEALADRGGYLPADKQAMVLLKALESPALKDADRAAVLAELLGQPAPSQAAALPVVDKPKP